jgi:hypothetical protein
MAAIKYRDPVTKQFVALVGGMSSSAADARYEPKGSVTTHEGKPDPHPQYLTSSELTGTFEPAGTMAGHVAQANPHAQYLLKTGGTMTGPLIVNADLTVAGSTIEIEGTNGSFYTATSRVGIEGYNGREIRLLTDGFVSLEGGTIYLSSNNPIWIQNAAGTASQRVTNLSAPTGTTDAVNKAYVDARPNILYGTSGTMPAGAKVGDIYCQTS